MPMHVISKKRLREFAAAHPESETALFRWYAVVRRATWGSFSDVRATLGATDLYHRCHVFNVGGNKYRIVAAIHYDTRRVYIRHVLTHAQYDLGKWKPECEPRKRAKETEHDD